MFDSCGYDRADKTSTAPNRILTICDRRGSPAHCVQESPYTSRPTYSLDR